MISRSFFECRTKRRGTFTVVLAGMLWLPLTVSGHPEIQSQIDLLTEQLQQTPGNALLLMKRGDLNRRHGDYLAAERDLAAAGRTEPVPAELNFFRGRLQLDSNQPAAAVGFFSLYLAEDPSNVNALILRADAHFLLHQPLEAAADYSSAIQLSDTPSPELYRKCALSLLAVGEPRWPAARAVIDSALARFSAEVSLLGVGVDIALAQDDLEGAEAYFGRVPAAIHSFPQWIERAELMTALGQDDPAVRIAGLRAARAMLRSAEQP